MIATEEILYLLEKSGKVLTTQEIVDATGLSYSTIARETKSLHKAGDITRIKGNGNSWLYGLETSSVKRTEDKVDKQKLPNPEVGISLRDIEKFLNRMAKGNWEHPIFKKQLELNRVLLSICDLAYEKATGSDVTDADLRPYRQSLEILLGQLNQYSDLVSSMLKQGYLWDSETFAAWLTENHTASELRSIVRDAKEHN